MGRYFCTPAAGKPHSFSVLLARHLASRAGRLGDVRLMNCRQKAKTPAVCRGRDGSGVFNSHRTRGTADVNQH